MRKGNSLYIIGMKNVSDITFSLHFREGDSSKKTSRKERVEHSICSDCCGNDAIPDLEKAGCLPLRDSLHLPLTT